MTDDREPPQRAERSEASQSVLAKVLGWLKAGYPQGIPQSDYVALLAVLHRRLTDYEVQMIVGELVRERDGDAEIALDEIADAIARVAKEQPGEDDIARVASRLAAGGWPLATPTSD
ncbi:DUF3349 domain-containing protein [Nocardia sp. CDC159]|uniref:DUF3349 domain-containing protein n=1 Tax=Nocardia pulmonis TaxID=2951408 RepID=A0A9X2IZG5_9NOCA|nr:MULTISPECIES: DUF3349 domain-containing protein [Nocardia]MCM6774911.1 DUF3349 domain-containing protein [Nocardia pulmonis]MCM6789842.1 DUF3349 domain-containing protein [Nocardia sp. CDC159]